MKINKLVTVLLAIFIAFNSYGKDLIAYPAANLFSTFEVEIFKESIEIQEHRLVLLVNHVLASTIDYPLEARENGEEGLVRAVIFFSHDNSKASIKFAKGNLESLESALVEAYSKVNLSRFISEDYEGRKVIPVKISFELE